MNFERGKSPTVAMGIGNLAKRGVTIKWPYLNKTVDGKFEQYLHVKYLVWALDGWYKFIEKKTSIFQFPASNENWPSPENPMVTYVITAEPGEEYLCQWDSDYRPIEYNEILDKFFRLVNHTPLFIEWVVDTNCEDIIKLLKVVE